MKPFVTDFLRFTAIQAVILAGIITLYPGPSNTYLAATMDKHDRARATPPPRVLLVGGSNVAFGIDSPAIRDALGREVVNLGLHVAIGLDFMLKEAADVARPGDTVVISPEYELFATDPSGVVMLQLIESRPASVRYVGVVQAMRLMDEALVYLRRVGKRSFEFKDRDEKPTPGYARDQFNDFGDVIGHHGEPGEIGPAGDEAQMPVFDPLVLRRRAADVQRFVSDMRARGVDVVVAFPPRPRGDVQDHESQRQVAQALRGAGVPLLNRPEDVWFDHQLFYDTRYHLTIEGKRQRTAKLIDGLRAHHGDFAP